MENFEALQTKMTLLSIIGGESCRYKGLRGELSIKQRFLWSASYLGRGESPFEVEGKNKQRRRRANRTERLKPKNTNLSLKMI